MSRPLWQEGWFAAVGPAERDLWRGVEAQHQVATMRLVDDLREQHLLEQLLETSKPAQHPAGQGLHYLLSTPFRYVSPWASRFREPDQPGAWYGADEPHTVAAEVAYWRWRFFRDSDGFQNEQLVTELTFFQARFSGSELNITLEPWSASRDAWRDPREYSACHALAAHVRQLQPPVAAIRYESARREGGLCSVVFEPASLRIPNPDQQQTWICKTTADLVLVAHGAEAIEFRQAAGR